MNTPHSSTPPIQQKYFASVTKEQFIIQLYDIGAILFGSFVLKSGITSPLYIDLRKIISHPPLLHQVEELLWSEINTCTYTTLCPVPTAAIPFASSLAFNRNKSLIMARPTIKDHGTRQTIEGIYKPGDTALVVEDLITTGASIFEVITILEQQQLIVRDIAVILDREGGGKERLAQQGYRLHALCTLTEVIDILEKNNKITAHVADQVKLFMQQIR